MAQLWGGRFTKETDQLVYNFNASISFDQKFYKQDIDGSIAHVTMLAKQHILTDAERDTIVAALTDIKNEIAEGTLEITGTYEDIHSFVEAMLIERTGETGKKLHTGRSRNDQVALDMKLYTRDEIKECDALLKDLLEEILTLMEAHTETFMPGFTHLQKAQPLTLAHHFGAYFEMFKRDRSRLADAKKRLNLCPLGSGALAGTTYPLDRNMVAELLGFDSVSSNSLDGVSDRDFCIELASALSLIMVHLSRFSEEIIMWCSWEFKFVELDDAFSTGSSIMPQKKNPDIAELVRGKSGRVFGDLTALLTVMKGIALAYNKDMQEDKEAIFDAVDTVKMCLTAFTPMLDTMKVIPQNMRKAAAGGFINATDCADWLTKNGVPFRDAYKATGELVARCIELGTDLENLPIEEYKKVCDVFNDDVYRAISLETCTNERKAFGGPASENVKAQAKRVAEIAKNL